MKEKKKRLRAYHQAVTKGLSSSSKFSGSCVLTLQTIPLKDLRLETSQILCDEDYVSSLYESNIISTEERNVLA